MKPMSSSLTLATFLPYRLSVLSASVSDGLARRYAERFSIGVAEWRVLATVAELGSVSATAVAAHAHMSKVKVSRAVAGLEVRGVLARSPNQRDRREAFLRLTEAGQAMYREIAPLALAYVEALLAGFSDAELTTLNGLMDELVRRAERLGPA